VVREGALRRYHWTERRKMRKTTQAKMRGELSKKEGQQRN
jgi:hypothetical protein